MVVIHKTKYLVDFQNIQEYLKRDEYVYTFIDCEKRQLCVYYVPNFINKKLNPMFSHSYIYLLFLDNESNFLWFEELVKTLDNVVYSNNGEKNSLNVYSICNFKVKRLNKESHEVFTNTLYV